jgi:hypothetical protein
MKYAKFILAVVATVITAVVAAMTDDHVTSRAVRRRVLSPDNLDVLAAPALHRDHPHHRPTVRQCAPHASWREGHIWPSGLRAASS